MKDKKNVLVLMSTYNGQKYLNTQLMSLARQKGVNLKLLVRDDGSTDDTLNILKKWKSKINIEYYSGENVGPARSFMNLIQRAETYDYYAFCDQDDYWDSNKLIIAINYLKNTITIPSLYLSATRIVDENLKYIRNNLIHSYPTFENAIIKNEAVGCTEVFNFALMKELKKYTPKFIKMHDSWVYRVCYAIGGKVYMDQIPHISYRQHSNNVIGYKENKLRKLKSQINTAFVDKIRIRQLIAKELNEGYSSEIGLKNKKIINSLISYPTDKTAKLFLLCNKDFKTPNKIINFKVKVAIILNRF